jgi:UDP-N-acetylmuramoyl-L-alanyl-D-glutamate--2,6-diaminopimelate ligase
VATAARKGGLRVLRFGVEVEGVPLRRGDLDLGVARIEATPRGLALQVFQTPGVGTTESEFRVDVPLLGRHNAWNAAAAMTTGLAFGLSRESVIAGIQMMPAVPGRLERIDAGQPFLVVVDYAHTPDALERALEAAREHGRGRVLLVFGCGGDRDREKRPVMGKVAAGRADRAWVTNDNPRSEDPAAIAAEIVRGATGNPVLAVELDRRAAIARAIAEARAGDTVVIAGKGHETTQTIGRQVLPFDDRIVARDELQALAARATGGRGRS